MGKQAKANLERIVYSQGQRREMPIAQDQQESKSDCLQRKEMTQTVLTIYHVRSGSVLEKRVEDE